jgi:oxygen-dependent protoporphyrinogen oxidase
VEKIQKQYPTLRIAGNLRDGIGIGDRIKQGFDEAKILCES